MVGTGRFELPTCRLGGDRSIHLSYVPTFAIHYYAKLFQRVGGEPQPSEQAGHEL
jgi:hypothetical protein